MTDKTGNIETAKNELTALIVSKSRLNEHDAALCVNKLQETKGDKVVLKQLETIKEKGNPVATKFVERALELGWITDSQTVAKTTSNSDGDSTLWDKVRIFSSTHAIEVTSFSKIENNNKKERVCISMAKKTASSGNYDWANAIYFALTPEEAIAVLMLLAGKVARLKSLVDQTEGIYHRTGDVNKKLIMTTQDKGALLELNQWESKGSTGPLKYVMPINAAGALSLSGFIATKVGNMHPYYGMNYQDIITMASHVIESGS